MKFSSALILTVLVVAGCAERKPLETSLPDDPDDIELTCFDSASTDNSITTLEGSFTIQAVPEPDGSAPRSCGSDFAPIVLQGSSFVSAIGQTNITLSHCAGIEPVSSDPATFELLNGQIMLEAEDGDTILATYLGEMTETASFIIRSEFVIIGGTGKFENATGSGCFRGTRRETQEVFDFELKAEIATSGS